MSVCARSQSVRKLIAGVVLVGLLVSVVPASTTGLRATGVRFGGDPDGAGGIPYTGGPQQFGAWHSNKTTDGLVIDAVGGPVAATFVVVTDSQATVVAGAVTGDDGTFCISLPVEPGLELSLPVEGIAGMPVTAGEPILIVLP